MEECVVACGNVLILEPFQAACRGDVGGTLGNRFHVLSSPGSLQSQVLPPLADY